MEKSFKDMDWVVGGNGTKLGVEEILDVLLENRGLESKKQKNEFINSKKPVELTLPDFDIDKKEVAKAIRRIVKARKGKQRVLIYGDYDADGICATAILWEVLYKNGVDVTPYIPDRFTDGYGLNSESIEKLLASDPGIKLIITVDNGIVASQAIKYANKQGVDVIVTDHHEKGRSTPQAHAVVHTKLTSGSGVAWILTREFLKYNKDKALSEGLELVAIGTISDQLPLVGVNRSLVKHGLRQLNKTSRVGILSLLKESGVTLGDISAYVVGFVIAPRINAMGRLANGLDSLRLLCTKSTVRARELSKLVGKTNRDRQKIMDEVITHAKGSAVENTSEFVVVVHESYHEGVIGLAAGRLVEEFGRPAIVIAKGDDVSKASARSISGVNLIKAIHELDDILLSAGGHEMAAGFSFDTSKLDLFLERISEVSKKYLQDVEMQKKLKIDLELSFEQLSFKLESALKAFEPHGQGNPTPTFITKAVEVVDARVVGKTAEHLKLKLKQGERYFDAIGFGMGSALISGFGDNPIDIVYALEENVWNGNVSLQLRVRDLLGI